MSPLRRAKSWMGRGLSASGLHRVVLGNGGIIVAFHRVNDSLCENGLTVSPRHFARFCRFFRTNFDVVSVGQLVGRLERNESIAGTLAITFDDGYLDNIEIAAPILRSVALPATFFVTSRFIGSTIVPWWDAKLPRHPGWMTWEHVRTLKHEGFDIGAHTRTHVDLGAVDGTEAEAEIRGSRQDLLDALGHAPDHFAYPYGRRTNLLDANRERIRSAGFHSCMSSHGGFARPGMDPFRLQRFPISTWFRSPGQFVFEALARRW